MSFEPIPGAAAISAFPSDIIAVIKNKARELIRFADCPLSVEEFLREIAELNDAHKRLLPPSPK